MIEFANSSRSDPAGLRERLLKRKPQSWACFASRRTKTSTTALAAAGCGSSPPRFAALRKSG